MINLSLKNENISSSMEVNEKNICIKTISLGLCMSGLLISDVFSLES